jgi:hypothetical protein
MSYTCRDNRICVASNTKVGANVAPREKNDTTLNRNTPTGLAYLQLLYYVYIRNLLTKLDTFKPSPRSDLLRVIRCNRRRIVDLNASPLLFVTIVEGQFPSTFPLRRTQP